MVTLVRAKVEVHDSLSDEMAIIRSRLGMNSGLVCFDAQEMMQRVRSMNQIYVCFLRNKHKR